MAFGKETVESATAASRDLNDAIYQHADAVRHLAESLEEEVGSYSAELGARITMLHESAQHISSAGLQIAQAGDRIAACGEHLAAGLQQTVYVMAAALLTFATGLFGWRYLVLGCMCLWMSGFEIYWRQVPLAAQRRQQAQPQDWQQAAGDCQQPDHQMQSQPPEQRKSRSCEGADDVSTNSGEASPAQQPVRFNGHNGGAAVAGDGAAACAPPALADRHTDIDGVFVSAAGAACGSPSGGTSSGCNGTSSGPLQDRVRGRIEQSLAAAKSVVQDGVPSGPPAQAPQPHQPH